MAFLYPPQPAGDFGERIEKWKAIVTDAYPGVETITEWTLHIPTKDGVPDFASGIQPQISLRHRQWRESPAGHRVWCMQCLHDRLIFNVKREDDNLHSYQELKTEAAGWLRRWSEHFGIDSFTGVGLEYVNRLDAKLTPQFVVDSGKDVTILISQVFKLFTSIPVGVGQFNIVRPYDCNVNLQFKAPLPGTLAIGVKGVEKGPLAVQISLKFTTALPKEFDCDMAFIHLDTVHGVIKEAFRNLFTPEALASFGLQ
jgi:uncharacterized protein (TIGR04255 family)